MNDPDTLSGDDTDLEEVAARTIDKLNKINAALMQRVERSMDQQANAFSLFQTAINQEAQIKARTEQLNTALSKLAQANQELSAARDAAERANLFKTRFFTAVGHDVLQPLHAARLNLSELAETQQDFTGVRLTNNIANALNSVEELLRSILDISKLEAGVFVPKLQCVSLNDVFSRLFVSLEPQTRRKGLKFRYRTTNLYVRSDPLMLRRMIQNLVANAVHYTSAGGVLLSARRRGANIAIEIWDQGPGIEIAERERIFQEFQRGTASGAGAGAGFGLGLTIVKRMSEALNHPLRLDSRFGRGSRFSILAPRDFTEPAGTVDKINADAMSPNLKALPVIVIDNDLAVLEAMQTLLTRWGCELRLARNIDDLDEILENRAFRPAMILADYHLDNDVIGLDAIARVRQAVDAPLPAILITADHTDATFKAASEVQCEVLNKPVRPAELRALMQHLAFRSGTGVQTPTM